MSGRRSSGHIRSTALRPRRVRKGSQGKICKDCCVDAGGAVSPSELSRIPAQQTTRVRLEPGPPLGQASAMDPLPRPLAFFLLLVPAGSTGNSRTSLTSPLYTTAFRRLLRDSGITPLLLPARSPDLNAFAERFVLSVTSECLDRLVPLGEAHLRAAVCAFADHYHEERPHQGLGNELIAPQTSSTGFGPVHCRERLGGLLKFYCREAA